MAMKVTVRKANTDDLVVINELTDSMHHHLASIYGLELSLQELEEEHFDEEELGNVYVAESALDGVVGYMSFSEGRDEWAGPCYMLEHIVVREIFRGLGIGKMLFEILLGKSKREGVNITAGTLARNERALRFYEELGFKQISTGLLLDLQKRIFTE